MLQHKKTIHLCLQIEWSHWFHFREGRSHLGGKMDIPCCLALAHAFLLISSAVTRRQNHCHWTRHQRTVPQLTASAAPTRFWPHMAACICQHVQRKRSVSLFLQWHFDRLVLFASRVSLIVFFYQHWFFLPPWPTPSGSRGGQGSERESTVSYQSEWCSCLRLIKKNDY